MGRILTMADVEFAVKGGSVFACGGGGWADHGRELGRQAIAAGKPELVPIDEVPEDALIATSAAIGAPGGLTEWEMRGEDYVRAVGLLQDAIGERIYGLIIGQNGMSSTLNGWLPGAVLGTKVIDAVGDVRAHPTGDMGSLGMAGRPDPTIQTAAGGNRAKHQYIELVARGTHRPASRRFSGSAADMAGGFIASAVIRSARLRQKTRGAGWHLAWRSALGQAISAAEAAGGKAVGTRFVPLSTARSSRRGHPARGGVHRARIRHRYDYRLQPPEIRGVARDERIHGGHRRRRRAAGDVSRCNYHARA